MAEFDGKVVLVTGASSGIGRASALMYASQGASVVVSDINEAGGNETVREIRDRGGKAVFVQADVSQPADNQRMVQETLKQFGRLDIAFNNAGIGGETNPVADYSLEGWQKVISINLSGVFYGMKYEIPAMLQAGGGSIVNMSSILGAVGFTSAPAYDAAKHGVVGLTQSAALDYSKRGIRVNAVGPAFISTPLISSLEENPQAKEALIKIHPMGRLGKAEEVAALVLWLSSDKASFVTGSYYPVDGGYLAQ